MLQNVPTMPEPGANRNLLFLHPRASDDKQTHGLTAQEPPHSRFRAPTKEELEGGEKAVGDFVWRFFIGPIAGAVVGIAIARNISFEEFRDFFSLGFNLNLGELADSEVSTDRATGGSTLESTGAKPPEPSPVTPTGAKPKFIDRVPEVPCATAPLPEVNKSATTAELNIDGIADRTSELGRAPTSTELESLETFLAGKNADPTQAADAFRTGVFTDRTGAVHTLWKSPVRDVAEVHPEFTLQAFFTTPRT